GKQYQLWAIVNGKPQNAGLLQNCNEFCYLSTNSNAQAFAITLEKTGGSEEPTLTEMLVLGQVKS
ncbi:MAG TPA: anti-sigma factor, partial [Flavihumibacter sp.]|nr:anti-sigma factor [Flavihumibacter sp.]